MLVGRMWPASDQPPRLARIGWRRVRPACVALGGPRRVSAALAGALVCGILLGLAAGPTTPSAAPRRVVVLPAGAVSPGDDRAPTASGAGLAALQAGEPAAPASADASSSSSKSSESSSADADSGDTSEPSAAAKPSAKTKTPAPAASKTTAKPAAAKPPPVKHVIVVALAEKGFAEAFGPRSKAPYLATELRAKGLLLRHYYATAHGGLPNLVALLSGQASNPALATGCPELTPFAVAGKPARDGEVRGRGCVFPATVRTLPAQLEAKQLGWRAYVEGADPAAGQPPGPCAPPPAPVAGTPAQRNPFAYFAAIAGATDCTAHVTGLAALAADLAAAGPAPALSLVLPDACHAGREGACPAGEPDGLARADAWLRELVPQLLAAPGYADDTLLVVTFDEARATGPQADLTSCCDQPRGVNEPASVDPQAPAEGGGRVGALVLSPRIKAAGVSNVAYNHFSLLRTTELAFGLRPLGLASDAGVKPFGNDVFGTGG
jgi:hypothetical protein